MQRKKEWMDGREKDGKTDGGLTCIIQTKKKKHNLIPREIGFSEIIVQKLNISTTGMLLLSVQYSAFRGGLLSAC